MKNLSLTFCLVVAALFGSVGTGTAGGHLPVCLGSPYLSDFFSKDQFSKVNVSVGWNKCIGKFYFTDGTYLKGEWRKGYFYYAKKTAYSLKPSPLHAAFKQISKEQRKQIQSNLKDSGFYKSSIDGLYGAGTKKALEAYNRDHLGGTDLTKMVDAERLLLGLLDASPPSETFNPNQPAASCKTNASICSEQQVCSFASNGGVDEKKWNASWPEHIEEAKKRGLNCGLPVENKLSGKSLVKAIQTELNRIGCEAGYPDGMAGKKTKWAVKEYTSKAGITLQAASWKTNGF